MPTDFDHFRKIAEEPDVEFLDLPAWVRGYSSEMVRHASRPDGRLAKNARLVGVLLRAKPEEMSMLEDAVAQLLAIQFLIERDGQLLIRNFARGQQSLAAKRQAKYRGKTANPAPSPRDAALSDVMPSDAALRDVTPVTTPRNSLKTRLEETRSDPPLPPAPSPTPKAPPVTDADPVAVRAKNYERDATGRAFLGDPREWAEFKLVVGEYAKRFNSQPNLREYHRDNRTKAIVAALADYTPDQLRLAIQEASRSKFSEDRFRQLDCVLHDSAKIDSWLDTAPPRAREAAAAGRLREFRRRAERPAEAEQTASSDRVPMPAEMVDRILGVKPAAKVAP